MSVKAHTTDNNREMVNHPKHYISNNNIEVIDIIEGFELDNFLLGNTLKYLLRHKMKGHPLEDLKKAKWYLDRYINNMEGKS